MHLKNKEKENNHILSINKELLSADMLAQDLQHLLDLLTPGFEIADFMANSLLFDIDKYNAFLSLRSYMCDQLELMVDLYKRGFEIHYPSCSYFDLQYFKIKTIIQKKNLSGEKADKYSKPFVRVFIDCLLHCLTTNFTTAWQNNVISDTEYNNESSKIREILDLKY